MPDAICPNCRRNYDLHSDKRRLPRLLSCGHTFCEKCLNQWMKNKQKKGFMVCSVCNAENHFDAASVDPLAAFAVDVYTVGVVTLGRLGASGGAGLEACDRLVARFEESSAFSHVDAPCSPQTPRADLDSLCSSCHSQDAVGVCPCGKFCNACFTGVHSGSKALAMHELRSLFQASCTRHPDTKIVFWCTTHNTPLCPSCFIPEHKECTVIGISEAHSHMKDVLSDQTQQLHYAKKVMADGDQKINHLLALLHGECKESKEALMAHVLDLHSQLQHRMNLLLLSLESQASSHLDQLISAKKNIFERLERCSKAERWLSRASRANAPTQVLLEAHDNLRRALGTDAIDFAIDEQAAKLEFVPGDLSFNGIGTVCSPTCRGVLYEVALPTSRRLFGRDPEPSSSGAAAGVRSASAHVARPSPKSTPPPAAAVDGGRIQSPSNSPRRPPGVAPLRATALASKATDGSPLVLEMPARRGGQGIAAVQDAAPQGADQKSSAATLPAAPVPHDPRFDDWTEVKVISLMTPSQFVVQCTSDLATIDRISSKLAIECGQNRLTSVSQLRKGELIAVLYSLDNRWYRARIQALPADPILSEKAPPDTHAYVEYIDFGNGEWVHFKQMRALPLAFQEYRSFGHKCCLSRINAVPTTNMECDFLTAVFDLVSGLILDEVARFKACSRDRSGVYGGDIMPPGSSKTLREIMEERNFAITRPIPELETAGVEIVEASVDVTISHCVDPNEFYVQQLGDWAELLANMMEDMQARYSARSAAPDKVHVGEMYCAEYALDQQWYRVVVNEVQFSGVVVQYIDYGNSEFLEWSGLRRLEQEFQLKPAMATRCFAADIHPTTKSLVWPSKACNRWKELCQEKDVILCRRGPVVEGKGYPVFLIDTSGDDDVFPSTIMVEESFAMLETDVQKASETRAASSTATRPAVTPSASSSISPAPRSQAQAPPCHALATAATATTTTTTASATAAGVPTQLEQQRPLAGGPGSAGATAIATPHSGAPARSAHPHRQAASPVAHSSPVRAPSPRVLAAGPSLASAPSAGAVLASRSSAESIRPTAPLQPPTSPPKKLDQRGGSAGSSPPKKLDQRGGSATVVDVEALRHRHEVVLQTRELEARLHGKQRQVLARADWALEFGRSPLDDDDLVLPTTAAVACFLYSPHQFYMQLKTDDLDALTRLGDELNVFAEHVSAECPSKDGWEAGHLCAACYEDGGWYRGRVVAVQGRRAKVYFVDYGNTETVSVGSLLPLRCDLARLPPQAICCALSRLAAMSPSEPQLQAQALDMMVEVISDTGVFELLVLGRRRRNDDGEFVLPVDLLYRLDAALPLDTSLSDILVMAEALAPVAGMPTTAPRRPYFPFQAPGGEAAASAAFSMRVTAIDDAGIIYGNEIPAGSVSSPLHQMTERLNAEMAALQDRPVPQRCWQGQCGCAFVKRHRTWFRCIVEELLPDLKVKVRLVDRGKKKVVNLLDFVSKSFERSLPAQAIQCTLQNAGKLGEEEISALRDLALHKQCTVSRQVTDSGDADGSDGSPLAVTVTLPGGEDMKVALDAKLEADRQPMLLSTTSDTPVQEKASPRYVSPHRRSSDSSWRGSTLNSINEEESGATPVPAPLGPLQGAVSRVQSDHKVFDSPVPGHRGQSAVPADVLNSHLADLLTEESCPSRYSRMPLPAVGETMSVKVVDIAHPNDFHVHVLSSPQRPKETCFSEQAAIGAACSQLASDSLSPFTRAPCAGTPCMAQFHPDVAWYRAEVVRCGQQESTADVRFVDYGSCSLGEDVSRLRQTPRALCQHPRQAVRVQLGGVEAPSSSATQGMDLVPDSRWPISTLAQVSAALEGRELTVKVEAAGPPLQVVLYVDGQRSLAELLLQGGLAVRTGNGHPAVATADDVPAAANATTPAKPVSTAEASAAKEVSLTPGVVSVAEVASLPEDASIAEATLPAKPASTVEYVPAGAEASLIVGTEASWVAGTEASLVVEAASLEVIESIAEAGSSAGAACMSEAVWSPSDHGCATEP